MPCRTGSGARPVAGALKRRLGPGLLTAYGVGVMVGAGIYVLVGAVAAGAGVWAPLAFLGAGVVAALSALSYAEFAARIPEAAGAAAYIEEGLGAHRLAVAVGLAIVAAGTISAAAVLRGGVGYLTAILDLPPALAIGALGAALTAIAMIGVLESLTFAAALTLVEVAGLGLIVWAGFAAEPVQDWRNPPAPVWTAVAGAAALAFFAFIGFEDIVNMAEEVHGPAAAVPRAIIAALVITTLLYVLVTLAAVRAVPAAELGRSEQPLALVWAAGIGPGTAVLSAIAVAAALNGVLAQIIMAARVLYGLGRRVPRLALFHDAHERLGTPVAATLLVGAGVILAALSLPVAALAEATSILLLAVFLLVNLALIRIKRVAPAAPFRVPGFVPWAGMLAALATLAAALGLGR